MVALACRVCGRRVESGVPVERLSRDEGRCPRCGARLHDDRRIAGRRIAVRRAAPAVEPGPPDGLERRVAERRASERRRVEAVAPWIIASDAEGEVEAGAGDGE